MAKKLTGVVADDRPSLIAGAELETTDGKNAGRITSTAFSPKLNRVIALALIRHDYLTVGTALRFGETTVTVRDLPFISN